MTVGYKKAWVPETEEFVLVELSIPAYAQTAENDIWGWYFSYTTGAQVAPGRKCRASKAVVTKIHGGHKRAVSMYDNSFVYEEGKTVEPGLPWEDTKTNWACGNGIHHFKDKASAIAYDNGSYMTEGGNIICGDYSKSKKDKPKKVVCFLVEDAKFDPEGDISHKMAEVIEAKKEYYVVYVTQGQGEAEAGTFGTVEEAEKAVKDGATRGDGSYRYVKVLPV